MKYILSILLGTLVGIIAVALNDRSITHFLLGMGLTGWSIHLFSLFEE